MKIIVGKSRKSKKSIRVSKKIVTKHNYGLLVYYNVDIDDTHKNLLKNTENIKIIDIQSRDEGNGSIVDAYISIKGPVKEIKKEIKKWIKNGGSYRKLSIIKE